MEYSGSFFFNPSSRADVLFLGNADPPPPPPFPGTSWSMMKMEEGLKRRSCPQSVVFDEEYFGEQSSDKKRRLTSQQVEVLEKSFWEEKKCKLEAERKMELASNLGLHPRQVAVWFQNRRARWKVKQLERDYHQLKSSHHYLLSHNNFLLKQNEILKAEVDLLSKKLQEGKEVEECGNGYEGSPKQLQLLADNFVFGNTYFHNDNMDDHIHANCSNDNCLPPPPNATDDEPLGWFWS